MYYGTLINYGKNNGTIPKNMKFRLPKVKYMVDYQKL